MLPERARPSCHQPSARNAVTSPSMSAWRASQRGARNRFTPPRLAGQSDGERRARARRGRHVDGAAVAVDDLAGDRQAESGALDGQLGRRTGPEEPGEEPWQFGVVDADAVVADRDLGTVLDGPGPHHDPAAGRRALDRVVDEAGQYPPE